MNFAQSISTSNNGEVAVCDGNKTYMYTWTGDEWDIYHTFELGSYVSLSDDGQTIAVSDETSMMVKIFTKENNAWSEEQSIESSEGGFEGDIKLSGDGLTIVIKYTQDLKIYRKANNQWVLFQENFIQKTKLVSTFLLNIGIIDFDINWDGTKVIFSQEWLDPEYNAFEIVYADANGLEIDYDVAQSLISRDKDSLVEVWDFYGEESYKKIFNIDGKFCKISGLGDRIIVGDPIEKAIQVREKNGKNWFEKIGNNIYSKSSDFGISMSINHYGDMISVYESLGTGRVKSFIYNNEGWASISTPFSLTFNQYVNQEYGEVHRLFKDGSKIAISQKNSSVEVFNLDKKTVYFEENQELDFGDLDWREREAYSLTSFISNQQHEAISNELANILPNDLPEERDHLIGGQQISKNYSWQIQQSVFGTPYVYGAMLDYYSIADDAMSPYGSLIGNYEFVNVVNIQKWRKSQISRHTSSFQHFYDDCNDRSTYSDGRCRPLWAEEEGYRKPISQSNVMELEYLYAKDSIIDRNLDSKGATQEELKINPQNYQSEGNKGSSLFFKDHTANRFWRNLYNSLTDVGISEVKVEKDLYDQQYISAKSSYGYESFRFLPSFGSLMKDRFNKSVIPVRNGQFDFLRLLSLGNTSSCGGSVPYVGYNQDGNIIERELICLPVNRLAEISTNDYDDREMKKYLVIFIQWSMTYVYPPSEKVMPMTIRRLYDLNDRFSYRGTSYGVYDHFPFLDFGMTPIRWNKSVK